MKLKELLKTITHQHYRVFLSDVNFFGMQRELDHDEIITHLDYTVVSLDDSWNIVIKTKRIV